MEKQRTWDEEVAHIRFVHSGFKWEEERKPYTGTICPHCQRLWDYVKNDWLPDIMQVRLCFRCDKGIISPAHKPVVVGTATVKVKLNGKS